MLQNNQDKNEATDTDEDDPNLSHRKHTHAPRKHTARTQKVPTLFRGRYHYPMPETAAVQSVGLPWHGSGRYYSVEKQFM